MESHCHCWWIYRPCLLVNNFQVNLLHIGLRVFQLGKKSVLINRMLQLINQWHWWVLDRPRNWCHWLHGNHLLNLEILTDNSVDYSFINSQFLGRCSGPKGGMVASWLVHSSLDRAVRVRALGPVSRKPRKLFGPVKPFFVHMFTVCKNGEVYTPETSCMRWTSPHIKKMWIRFEILRWLYGPEKFPMLSRNRPLDRDIVLCSWARHLTLTVPLSTQVYKWVPANVMLGVTLRWTSFVLQKPG